MELIEKLISGPSDAAVALLFDNNDEVFWVDWRENDDVLAEYCESIIKSKKLSSFWEGDNLVIRYGEVSKEVPLARTGGDRHITLVTINETLAPDYEIRMAWDSDGGDTLAFTILSTGNWNSLESKYGVEKVNRAFLRLSIDLNTFTDPLNGHRPELKQKNKWWQFWK